MYSCQRWNPLVVTTQICDDRAILEVSVYSFVFGSLCMASFYCVSCTVQLGVISKHIEGTLNSTICVTNKGVEERWSR